jgi:hypothetical protein
MGGKILPVTSSYITHESTCDDSRNCHWPAFQNMFYFGPHCTKKSKTRTLLVTRAFVHQPSGRGGRGKYVGPARKLCFKCVPYTTSSTNCKWSRTGAKLHLLIFRVGQHQPKVSSGNNFLIGVEGNRSKPCAPALCCHPAYFHVLNFKFFT